MAPPLAHIWLCRWRVAILFATTLTRAALDGSAENTADAAICAHEHNISCSDGHVNIDRYHVRYLQSSSVPLIGGSIQVWAGGGSSTSVSGAATSLSLSYPMQLQPGPDGLVNLVTSLWIGKTSPTFVGGTIANVMGNGASCTCTTPAGSDCFTNVGVAATSMIENYATSVVFSPAGDIMYISDTCYNSIRKVDVATGTYTGFLAGPSSTYADTGNGGQATSATIQGPMGLSVDTSGNVYFATGGGQVRRVTIATGIVDLYIGKSSQGCDGDGGSRTNAHLTSPQMTLFDAGGNFYVADANCHNVRKVSIATGIISTILGSASGTRGTGSSARGLAATSTLLYGPDSLAFDGSGNMYVGELWGCRIGVLSASDGNFYNVAGTGSCTVGGGSGGPASSATFKEPRGIAFDPSKSWLYVVDLGSNNVRVIYATVTPSSTAAASSSSSLTVSPTATASNSLGSTSTTSTFTASPSVTASALSTTTQTSTQTPTQSQTATQTATHTTTSTSTSSYTSTPTVTSTQTSSKSPTKSITSTATSSTTSSSTASQTGTSTSSTSRLPFIATAFVFAQAPATSIVSSGGPSLSLLLGGHRDANCTVNVALGFRNDTVGASETLGGVVKTDDGMFQWQIPSLPNGWLLFATLPGSDTVLSAAVITLEVQGLLSLPVVVPDTDDCPLALPQPALSYNAHPLGLDFEPAAVLIVLPNATQGSGATLAYTIAGEWSAVSWNGSALALPLLVTVCGRDVTVTAWLTKPGMSTTQVATLTLPMSLARPCMTSSTYFGSSSAPVSPTLAYRTGSAGADAVGIVTVPLAQTVALRVTDVGRNPLLTFAVIGPSVTSINLGAASMGLSNFGIEFASTVTFPLMWSEVAAGTDLAMSLSNSESSGVAVCGGSSVSPTILTCNPDTGIACVDCGGSSASPCVLQYQECWSGAQPVIMHTPARTGCFAGVWYPLSAQVCVNTMALSLTPSPIAAPSFNPSVTPSPVVALPSPSSTQPGGAQTVGVCNAVTGVVCVIDAAEAAARALQSQQSLCTLSFSECWDGANTAVVMPTPANLGCLGGIMVRLASQQCAASRQLQATVEAPGSSCPTQCGTKIQWDMTGDSNGSAGLVDSDVPLGTLCYVDSSGTALLVDIDDPLCAAIGVSCADFAIGAAVCYDASVAAPADAGCCTDAYITCDGAPLQVRTVPHGTACLDGMLVRAATCNVGSVVSNTVQVIASVSASGVTPDWYGPVEAGAIATAVSAALNSGATGIPLVVASSDVGVAAVPLTGHIPIPPRDAVPLETFFPAATPLAGVQQVTAGAPILAAGIGATNLILTVDATHETARAIADTLATITRTDATIGMSFVTASLAGIGSPITLTRTASAEVQVTGLNSNPNTGGDFGAGDATTITVSRAVAGFVVTLIVCVLAAVMVRRRRADARVKHARATYAVARALHQAKSQQPVSNSPEDAVLTNMMVSNCNAYDANQVTAADYAHNTRGNML